MVKGIIKEIRKRLGLIRPSSIAIDELGLNNGDSLQLPIQQNKGGPVKNYVAEVYLNTGEGFYFNFASDKSNTVDATDDFLILMSNTVGVTLMIDNAPMTIMFNHVNRFFVFETNEYANVALARELGEGYGN